MEAEWIGGPKDGLVVDLPDDVLTVKEFDDDGQRWLYPVQYGERRFIDYRLRRRVMPPPPPPPRRRNKP